MKLWWRRVRTLQLGCLRVKTESKIQKAILDWLHFIGAYTIKIVTANKAGVPDIVGVYEGQFFAIEVKKLGGKARPLQLAQIRRIISAGGLAFEADSLDIVKHEFYKNFNNIII